MMRGNSIPFPIASLTAALLLLSGETQAQSPPAQQLDAAAVATSDVYGAKAAAEIVKAGGNVVDAAVAVAFVEAVTYPEAGNIGGGGFTTKLPTCSSRRCSA